MHQPDQPPMQIFYERDLTPPPRIVYERSLSPPIRIVYERSLSPPPRIVHKRPLSPPIHVQHASSPTPRVRYSSTDHRPILTPARKRRQRKQSRARDAVNKSTSSHIPAIDPLNLGASTTVAEPNTLLEGAPIDNDAVHQNMFDGSYHPNNNSTEPHPGDDESHKYAVRRAKRSRAKLEVLKPKERRSNAYLGYSQRKSTGGSSEEGSLQCR